MIRMVGYILFLAGALHSAVSVSGPILQGIPATLNLIDFAKQVSADYVREFEGLILAVVSHIIPGLQIPSAWVTIGSVFLFILVRIGYSTSISVRRQDDLIERELSLRRYPDFWVKYFTQPERGNVGMRKLGYGATILAVFVSLPALFYLHGTTDALKNTAYDSLITAPLVFVILILFLLMSTAASLSAIATFGQLISLTVIVTAIAFAPGDPILLFSICLLLSVSIIIGADLAVFRHEAWIAKNFADVVGQKIEFSQKISSQIEQVD